jgi:protein translocase SecG subunit
MERETLFSLILMFVAIVIIAVLLLQVRGSGSSLFGEATSTFRSRRGVEQLLFRSTIVLAVIFIGVAIANVRFS